MEVSANMTILRVYAQSIDFTTMAHINVGRVLRESNTCAFEGIPRVELLSPSCKELISFLLHP